MNKLLFIPEKKQLIAFSEGSGENLIEDDYENGYNDYLNYSQTIVDNDLIEILSSGDSIIPYDAGMFLFNNEKYNVNSIKIIDALIEYIFGEKAGYIILE